MVVRAIRGRDGKDGATEVKPRDRACARRVVVFFVVFLCTIIVLNNGASIVLFSINPLPHIAFLPHPNIGRPTPRWGSRNLIKKNRDGGGRLATTPTMILMISKYFF